MQSCGGESGQKAVGSCAVVDVGMAVGAGVGADVGTGVYCGVGTGVGTLQVNVQQPP